jgi:hypothetical protein
MIAGKPENTHTAAIVRLVDEHCNAGAIEHSFCWSYADGYSRTSATRESALISPDVYITINPRRVKVGDL